MKKKIIPVIAVIVAVIIGIIIFKLPKKFSDYVTTEEKMYVAIVEERVYENELENKNYISYEFEIGQEEGLAICEILKDYKFYRCFDTIRGKNNITCGEKDTMVVISLDNHSITICSNGKALVDNRIYKTKSKDIIDRILHITTPS